MKTWLNVTLLLLVMLGLTAHEQVASKPACGTPDVVVAVAPNYFPLALATRASGEVVVEVKVDASGLVTSVQPVSGDQVLAAGSMNIARRWHFSLAEDRTSVRTAQLTFVYRLVPRGTLALDLLPIFKPPYRIEVAHEMPDERPLPQSKRSSSNH
jgi:TonB family protein